MSSIFRRATFLPSFFVMRGEWNVKKAVPPADYVFTHQVASTGSGSTPASASCIASGRR